MRSRIETWSGRAGSLALVAGLLLSGTSAFAQQLRNELYRVAVFDEAQGKVPESYWIGVACGELTDSLRAQLELPEGQGVLIDDVIPESPAAQVGLMKYDVIVSAGEKTLTNPQDLVEAVAQAKDAELNLQVMRAAKKLTIAVKPAVRPQQPGEAAVVEVPPDANAGRLQELIQQLMKQQQGDAHVRFRMMHPGMVLPLGIPMPPTPFDTSLPDNLSISITRHGKEPAKISVKQGEKSWELQDMGPTGPGQERPTQGGLESLPPDVRMHVERMLGRVPMMMGGGMGRATMMGPGATPVQPRVAIVEGYEANPAVRQLVPAVPAPGQPVPAPDQQRVIRRMRPPEVGGIEQRLDELNKQIHELREAVERLQKQGDGSQ